MSAPRGVCSRGGCPLRGVPGPGGVPGPRGGVPGVGGVPGPGRDAWWRPPGTATAAECILVPALLLV